ncbi:hypothetical protein, conserved [Babesia ovata]|uniref:Extracellular matrix-binding ebh n=1 Tax=Babesia ovata TaxID=189622 RepID=A0A2H6KGL4_9APIC|nr:uncharacterized protein BOVATA_036140 [Babesia ovata]GBE62121.1 hypothetical protein, conserved [Babesia ovata]
MFDSRGRGDANLELLGGCCELASTVVSAASGFGARGMAPKALTDCPENLREAIDWLIQVKQGGGISRLSQALGKLLDHVAQDAQTSLPSLPESDGPSAGDVISRLKEFRSSLPKDSAHPNENILHNLCSSFETFLGYKPPGIYDGSGIVYGSASRLCDAILAFLYALFTDVYDNQPYVSGRSILHDVLDKHLKPQLRQGHKGFTHAIPLVADGLRKYNQAVSASNEKVKKPINDLLTYVGEGGVLLTKVNKIQVPKESTPLKPEEAEKAVTAASDLVDQCVGEAKKIQHPFEAAKRGNIVDQYNDLNLQLREKIRNARRNIGHEAKRLKQLSKRERKNLEAFIKMIKQALHKLKTDVNAQITKKVEELVRQLKDKVQAILAQLEKISTSLGQYIMDLDKWIEKTTKDIKAAQKLVQNILDEVNGNVEDKNLNHKHNLDEAIATVESKLEERAADLTQWKAAAQKVLQGTIDSSGNVYKDLDPNQKQGPGETTKIGKGLQQITTAKEKVEGVSSELGNIHGDLQTWNSTASSVLSQVVSKAQDVRNKLDPGGTDTIGKSIKQIAEGKEGIDTANQTLGTQVKSLEKWINDAEKIREQAEKKAREAYDKLKVNKTLSQNVQKIVDANKKIASVHTELGKVHGNLGEWKQQAGDVLQGAINNAQFVYDRLGDGQPVSQGIDKIESNNSLIKDANEKLGTEVTALGKWSKAAKDVISKADGKCVKILEKVKTTDQKSVIFTQADLLHKDGKRLLQAAITAKQQVEQNVTAALEAVVQMDKSLKTDLKDVKQDIKIGIDHVIKTLQVKELDTLVKNDLRTLRGRISELGQQADTSTSGNGLVGAQLKALEDAKNILDNGAVQQIKLAEQGLVGKFQSEIQVKLQSAVSEVDQAIGNLGGKFGGTDKTTVDKIFSHIKEKVGKIRGTAGNGRWDNEGGQGLEGIKSKVKSYVHAFTGGDGTQFNEIVKGWIERTIMPYNGAVRMMVGKNGRYDDSEKSNIENVALAFKEQLKIQADSAGEVVQQIKNGSGGDIAKSIQAVKDGCETFAKYLDTELQKPDSANSGIVSKVKEPLKTYIQSTAKCICDCSHCNQDCKQNSVASAILCALSSVGRQVSNELSSLLLNIADGTIDSRPGDNSIAAILDKITSIAEELDDKLKAATQQQPPATSTESPAKAVDNRSSEVSRQVEGLTNTFTSKVTSELTKAVNQLPGAVTDFDTEAQKLIKAAAKTAITKAAEEISQDGQEINLKTTMDKFHTAYDPIQKDLQKQLDAEVEKHIGDDDPAGLKGVTADKVKLSQLFTLYRGHVVPGKVSAAGGLKGTAEEGKLPEAIGNIKTEVFEKLNMIEPSPRNGKAEITTDTFTGPFDTIQKELGEIKRLVENRTQQQPVQDDEGVKDLLKKLEQGLEKGKLSDVADKGLQEIYEKINGLQKDPFQKTTEIEKSVKEIKAQLEELRKKLKKENGDKDKDDVINRLKYMQEKGLGTEQNVWTPNGQPLSGLGKIQGELKKQNDILPGQTKIIGEAMRQIQLELFRMGIKIQNVFNDDDILDKLRRLQYRIGKGKNIGLEAIYKAIKNLQEHPFKQKPTEIDEANNLIKQELTTLQAVLQDKPGNDVIKSLEDLKNTGLSGTKWDENRNGKSKSLQTIESDLKGQQNELGQQPGKIDQGVQDITGELDSLRQKLKDEVNKKLDDLKNHGLNNGNETWNDNGFEKGLTQITTDIETIKSKDVEDVKEKLKELCTAIRMLAKDAEWFLNELKDGKIGEQLKQIRDEIDKLHGRLVDGPIKDLRAFLRFLDNGKAQIIHDLHAYVNKEVKQAEEALINEARRQCASNIKELLTLFARKVEEELDPLPPLINGDLQKGYKGFVKQVEGKPEPQVAGAQGEFEKFEELVKTLPTEPKERVFKKLAAVFMHFYGELKAYVHKEIRREHKEEGKKKNPVPQEPETLYTDKLVRVTLSLNALLEYIRTEDIFDHRLQALLHSLTDALSNLRPESFARPSSPLLDGLVEGLTKFAAEFTCAYVSAYAGAQFTDGQGEKYAKVFLTTLPTLCDAFNRLAEQCGKNGRWRDLHINSSSKLGTFLQRCGYKVATSPFDQDGELRDDCNGRDVYVLVSQKIEETDNNEHLEKCLSLTHACNLIELLKCLCTHLQQYYRTCHLKVHPSPRPPCSIYEMLTWCCGLPHNAVYLSVTHDALPSLFEAPDEPDSTDSEVSLTDLSSLALVAHPESITAASLTDALTEVCHRSHSVLTTLLGYGHAGGIYAVDFNANPGGLLYPCDTDDFICLLFDVIKRLHHQLHFLYRRCLYNTRHGGWLDCWYGRGVGGSSWKCNTMQCANQMCDQQCNQTHNQICNQSCDQHPKCGVKSPLQSFLEDGLVGFLPHAVTPMDTCVKCSGCDTKSPGLPCKTPMGLSNITRLASRAFSGRHIMDVLGAFCGGASSPLTRLCGFLNCLLTRPPRTPDDLFAFFYQFICDWSDGVEHRKAAFEDAVGDACFWQRGVTLDVSTVFGISDHGNETEMPHLTGDLFSLVKCNGTPHSAPSHPCGPYLKPLNHDVRATFAREYAHLYLSWVVYLTETFYDLLKQLLQDCERTCAEATSTCHANSCDNDCTAKHRPMAQGSEHLDSCPSIVDCDHTTPTLFQYGFALRDVHTLAGSTHGQQNKRTCEDFCMALRIVVKAMNPLHRLAHETIPEYLYRIRAPFLYTIIALWLTATIYILHSLLYRMDVLRIRSHLLTTKASHLIDVKALLAGSRKMLSLYRDVDYFDDDFHP